MDCAFLNNRKACTAAGAYPIASDKEHQPGSRSPHHEEEAFRNSYQYYVYMNYPVEATLHNLAMVWRTSSSEMAVVQLLK